MVTIGFLVEGHSESILIKSDSFQSYLTSVNLHCESNLVINAIGKFNLYNPNGETSKLELRVLGWLKTLEDKGAEKIFILLDLHESDDSYTVFKSKVYHRPTNIIIVAKHTIEAWYLADTNALSKCLGFNIRNVNFPESFTNPFEEIKRLKLLNNNRGFDKKILTRNIVDSGFSLEAASLHPNCPSATYFRDKLLEVATE